MHQRLVSEVNELGSASDVQELTGIRPEKTGGMMDLMQTPMAKHILIIPFSCKLESGEPVPVFCTALSWCHT